MKEAGRVLVGPVRTPRILAGPTAAWSVYGAASGAFQGSEVRQRATLQQLGNQAIHPNACMLFSAAQYTRRLEANGNNARFNWVPDTFDEAAEIDWTPLWSLTAEQFRYLPTAYCYYGGSCLTVTMCRGPM